MPPRRNTHGPQTAFDAMTNADLRSRLRLLKRSIGRSNAIQSGRKQNRLERFKRIVQNEGLDPWTLGGRVLSASPRPVRRSSSSTSSVATAAVMALSLIHI